DRPAEAGLRRFENQELEVLAVIVDRHSPFPIVILAHQLIVRADPGTPYRLFVRHITTTIKKARPSRATSCCDRTADNGCRRSRAGCYGTGRRARSCTRGIPTGRDTSPSRNSR